MPLADFMLSNMNTALNTNCNFSTLCLAIFLGNILCAYSVSLIQDVKDIVDSANDIVEDVSYGLKKLSAGIQYVDDFVNSAGKTECAFRCPPGKKPIPRPKYKPIATGCGVYGIELTVSKTPQKEFTECCNYHDICYGTCLSEKSVCDTKFQKCLEKSCGKYSKDHRKKAYSDCIGTAKLFHLATQALGCIPYQDAQSEACLCVSHDEL